MRDPYPDMKNAKQNSPGFDVAGPSLQRQHKTPQCNQPGPGLSGISIVGLMD